MAFESPIETTYDLYFEGSMKVLLPLLMFGLSLLVAGPAFAANDRVQGYKRPSVCLKTNIRCVLKQLNGKKYWCLKTSIQRNLDSRHTSQPLARTRRTNMGNCAKILDVDAPN